MSTKPLVSKNYFLGVKFFVIFFLLSNGGFLTTGIISRGNYTTISVSESKDLIVSNDELFILDVRTNDEFNDGHIPEAYLIPHTEISTRQDELPNNKSRPILVYCRSGTRSAAASNTLDSLNYTQVYNMNGGFDAWKDTGYLYETGPFVKPITTSNTTELSSTEQTSTSSTHSTTTPAFEFTFVIQLFGLTLIVIKKQRK